MESEELLRLGYFKIRKDKCELPDGRIMPAYYVVEFNNWVQMLSITTDEKLILVDQYRHATGEHYLELPGGSAEPHNGESEAQSALRELEEETGYSGDVEFLCLHEPNPALQSNQVHIYLATNCREIGKQNLDPYEDIQVVLKPVKEVYEMAEAGEFKHSLFLATLMLARPKLKAMGLL
ncbi:MAG: NUDIX hydrolase [Bdellovibrionales bacterium]